jgi:Na+/proline symporter
VLAQGSGTLVAFLGIFGYGLFACTLVPALAIGLTWEGATREGAIASIALGLGLTLALESVAWLGWMTLPAGVTVTGLTLVTSMLVFVGVSVATRERAGGQLDADVRAIIAGQRELQVSGVRSLESGAPYRSSSYLTPDT